MSYSGPDSSSPHEKAPNTEFDVFFMTSTKVGLGHVSRAVAVANKLSSNDFGVSFGIYEHAKTYIEGMCTRDIQTEPILYDFGPGRLPKDLDDPVPYNSFVSENRVWLEKLTDSSIVITDFVANAAYLRKYLNQRNLLNTQVIGIYHSFEGYSSNENDVMEWQSKINRVVNCLDICFLTEPKRTHSLPRITTEGTLIIPIDPIVHPVNMQPVEVKTQIGLDGSDEYILIQAGMRGNTPLKEFILSIPDDNPEYFVLMGWDFDEEIKQKINGHPRIKIIEKSPIGNELVAAAKGVIAKPGMQTLMEAITYNIPILLVPDNHPERKLKIQMLGEVINDDNIPVLLDDTKAYFEQIRAWLESADQQVQAFRNIGSHGAEQVVSYLKSFSTERHLASLVDYDKPEPVTSTPDGKSSARLPPTASGELVSMIKKEIRESLIEPLQESDIPHTLILFGGVAKEMLRPDSDIDVLLVVPDTALYQLTTAWKIDLEHPLSEQRINSLIDHEHDALRIKAKTELGKELNISLMTEASYQKIYDPTIGYFKEELGRGLNSNPYSTGDFQGHTITMPKVVERVVDGVTVKERRSPGIIRRDDAATVFGVKHRMLLTAENMHDGLSLGDPTRKLMRGMARAVLYWNGLYIKEGDAIVGIKPEAFDANYFYRLLRDPLDMVGIKMQRKIRNLYFNELRRLQVIYSSRRKGTS